MNGVERSSAPGSISAAWSPQPPAGMTPAPESIDQSHPLVNPDLERKGNATMTVTTDTGATSPNPGLARPARHRDEAVIAVVIGRGPADDLLPSIEAAVRAVRSAAFDYGHTSTGDVEGVAADRSAKPTAARRSRGCTHVEARSAEAEAKQREYIRAVGERICEIVQRNNAPTSEAHICRQLGTAQLRHVAEAFADLLRGDVLRVVGRNNKGNAVYWFGSTATGTCRGQYGPSDRMERVDALDDAAKRALDPPSAPPPTAPYVYPSQRTETWCWGSANEHLFRGSRADT